MRSIGGHLRTGLVLGVAIVGALGGGLLYEYVRRGSVDEFDRTIKAKARGVGAFVERSGDFLEFNLAAGALPEFDGGAEPEYFQIFLADGRSVVRSPSLKDRDLPFRFRRDGHAEVFDLDLPDGRPGRGAGVVCALRTSGADDAEDRPDGEEAAVEGAPREVLIVVAARSRESLDASLQRLLVGISGVALAMGLSVFVLVTFVVRSGLAPLERLAQRAAQIDSRSLAARLPDAGCPREIASLTAGLNGLLSRLEAAFRRERRMTANMAHELRTPIAELGVASDLARRWSDDPGFRSNLAQTAHEVASRMGRTVSSLLHLARVEAGSEPILIEPISIAELLHEAWSAHERLLEGRRIESEGSPDGVELLTDRALLGVVFSSLVENSIRHSRPGERIRTVFHSHGSDLSWQISNPAPDLARDDLPQLTEAFWRKDAARSPTQGSGLGLSIAKVAIDVLGGRLDFDLSDGEFTATVVLAIDQGKGAGVPAGSSSDNPREPASEKMRRRDDATRPPAVGATQSSLTVGESPCRDPSDRSRPRSSARPQRSSS